MAGLEALGADVGASSDPDAWPAEMRRSLTESKRLGVGFDEAWEAAEREYPAPRPREYPAPRPWGARRSPRGGEFESAWHFTRRHFQAAYQDDPEPEPWPEPSGLVCA